MREATIAESLREANERRGLHPGMFRDLGHRAERHVLGTLESEGCQLLQPLGHHFPSRDEERT
jgi:hypothetical protein